MNVKSVQEHRKRIDRLAIGTIKLFSMVAVGILVVILGYVCAKGLVSSRYSESLVVPGRSSDGQPVVVLANVKTKLHDIPYDTLHQLFNAQVFSLRKITGADLDVKLFIETGLEQAASAYLGLDAASLAKSEVYSVAADHIIARVAAEHGAVALVSPALATVLGTTKAVKEVPLYDMVVATHPSVTALVGNVRLSSVDQSHLAPLFDGTYRSWSELGGPDLPVRVVQAPADVAAVAGSVAMTTMREALENKAVMLGIMARERRWNFSRDFVFGKPVEMGKYGGISTIMGNTLLMVFLTLLICAPVGVGAAIFLVEYRVDRRIMAIVRSGVDLLAGIPSIIFGLFGLLVFVQLAGWSFSLLSGSMTLAIMILPTVIRTSEEALRSVPRGLREASVALGATKWETIWNVMIPAASPGITGGVVLAIGRAVGETAALIYTIGSGTDLADGLLQSARVLAMHIFLTITEGQSMDRAFSSAMVLIVLVLAINVAARYFMRRLFRHGKP
jgi:phosphate transport system permease protein